MNHRVPITSAAEHVCPPIPGFERLNYYYGQPLGVADFQTEQRYFVDKLRLHNRCFHGYGIVCGLEVKPLPGPEDCFREVRRRRWELKHAIADVDARIAEARDEMAMGTKDKSTPQLERLLADREDIERCLEKLPDCHPARPPAEICVGCGWAIDCDGREIVVRQPQRLDLWALLSAEQRHQAKQAEEQGEARIHIELSVCYCEQPTYPSRPVLTDTCAAASKCVYGRIREGFRFRVSLTPSDRDKRCSNCCEACESECVVLAYIHWDPAQPITEDDIDWRPRRSVSVYEPTVITGISWVHGATYMLEQAKTVLGTNECSDGIEVAFSRPVYAETLLPGVVDLWRVQGGKGLSGILSHIEGAFVDKPDCGLIESFKYRDESGETLNRGDRVLIIIRGNFILDECCRPVDGEHVGGRVPQLKGYEIEGFDQDSVPPAPPCAVAQRPPWTSGNGRAGATFESWFFIKASKEKAS